MNTDHASTAKRSQGLWSKWPVTTVAGLASLMSLAVLLAAGSREQPEPAPLELGASAIEVEAEEPTDEEAPASSPTRHRGEEGRMGKPTSKSKSGLYAMKGPKDPIPASPYGGAFAVGSDDADVWGSLTGTEIGEAYGVGGLGLVGTGRGGGGTGEGTIGLGSGYGGRESRRHTGRDGSFDQAIHSSTLTVGAVDDNADAAGFKKAMKRLADARAGLDMPASLWDTAPPKQRHEAKPGALDIALVIDTTGSMGDELEYLKVEVRDIARKISREHPGVAQRWGLVVYRDQGDEYVTRRVDFRGIKEFVAELGKHEAGGGGDEPEAMDAALAASVDLSWSEGPQTARMVFLVADAPSHPGAPARRFAEQVMEHRADGTAIYPVAGSGVSDQAEVQLRLAAKATGGHYIFLTDHSGVGGSHKEARVDQYTVETLHDAMTRMIRRELGNPQPAKVTPEPPEPPEEPTPAEPTADVTPEPPFFSSYHRPTESEPTALTDHEPADEPDLWQTLRERLTAHFLFASSVALLMFAAMGLDAFIQRRRRLLRAMDSND